MSTFVYLLAAGYRYCVVHVKPVLSSPSFLPWMLNFIPNLCSGVYSCFREKAQLSLSRKPGPVALKCKLKDAIKCFVLANKSEVTMFKISLIKRILKYT